MNITFILFYYEPELPTINYLYGPIIDGLIAKGHNITILAPNPVRGVSEVDQKNYLTKEVRRDGHLTIHRIKCYTYKPKNYTKIKLLKRYLSVSLNLYRKLKKIKSDLVFLSTNPPLLQSYLVSKYCHKKGIHLVYNVQDIYPDNIFKKDTLMYKVFNPLQVTTLKNATSVITISETMKQTLSEKGNFKDKIKVIYNFDISEVASAKQSGKPSLFDKQYFNVVYAGNIGYVQDLDVVLSAAKLLLDNPKIKFHIFGEGSQALRIKKRISEEKITNTTFYPPLGVKESGYLYRDADVNIVSILPGVIKTALPLKTASVVSSGQPIIFIGLEEGHNEEWIYNQKEVYPINNRDYHMLAQNIVSLYEREKSQISESPNNELFDQKTNVNAYISTILGIFN